MSQRLIFRMLIMNKSYVLKFEALMVPRDIWPKRNDILSSFSWKSIIIFLRNYFTIKQSRILLLWGIVCLFFLQPKLCSHVRPFRRSGWVFFVHPRTAHTWASPEKISSPFHFGFRLSYFHISHITRSPNWKSKTSIKHWIEKSEQESSRQPTQSSRTFAPYIKKSKQLLEADQ
jgi:hypothetical protein